MEPATVECVQCGVVIDANASRLYVQEQQMQHSTIHGPEMRVINTFGPYCTYRCVADDAEEME